MSLIIAAMIHASHDAKLHPHGDYNRVLSKRFSVFFAPALASRDGFVVVVVVVVVFPAPRYRLSTLIGLR